MFAIAYLGLRETAHSHHQIRDGCGRCNMQSEEETLDTVHANPTTSTHWVAYETDLPYSSLVYTVYAKTVQRLQPGYNNLHLQSCWWLLIRTIYEPDILCHVLGMRRKFHPHQWPLWIMLLFTLHFKKHWQSSLESTLPNWIMHDSKYHRNSVYWFP